MEFFIGVISLALSALTLLVWFSDNQDLQIITQRLGALLLILIGLLIFWKTKTINWKKLLIGTFSGLLLIWLFICWMGDWFALASAIGLCFILGISFLIGLLLNSQVRGKAVLILFSVGWLALSLYGYMRFASSTNPPMNWGFASEKGGFYHAVSRGQYGDSLTVLIKGSIGPLVKYHDSTSSSTPPDAKEQFQYFKKIGQGIWMYYHSLEDNFSLPLVLLLFPLFIYINRFAKRHLMWLISLALSYLFLAVLMTFIAPPGSIDLLSQWMMKVFHLQSHCILVIGMGYGLTCGLLYLEKKSDYPLIRWVPAILFLSFIPLNDNAQTSNQRNHWFGWHYGVDMLRNVDRHAVIFGGTDPGRFIPTYTIFCESTQDQRWKKEPTFDRSDLYIITQNALADRYYLNYIRHHYDDTYRPKNFSSFEKWLGRDRQYPKPSLQIMNDEEFGKTFMEIAQKKAQPDAQGRVELSGFDDVFSINAEIARKIFEANKARHTFYVEESFPMPWMYPHAVPDGLFIRLHSEPLSKISPEVVAQDQEYWKKYMNFLLSNPDYHQDPPAKRSFSKLRCSIGNLYLYRRMMNEAEETYRQAYRLDPTNAEAVIRLNEILMQNKKTEEALTLIQSAIEKDPYQEQYKGTLKNVQNLIELQLKEKELRENLAQSSDYYELHYQLFQNILLQRRLDEIDPLALNVLQFENLPTEIIHEVFKIMNQLQRYEVLQKAVAYQLKLDPKNASWHYAQANLYLIQQKLPMAIQSMEKAWKSNPQLVRESLLKDPLWNAHLQEPRVQKWVR